MGFLNIRIDDELEGEFRQKTVENLGWRKGNLKLAVEQGIRLWMKEH